MAKTKYHFNPDTLHYERVRLSVWRLVGRLMGFLASSVVFAALISIAVYKYVDSPKEKSLKRKISQLEGNYDILQNRVKTLNTIMVDLQNRDNNIYRTIFEAEPLPLAVRQAQSKGDLYKLLQTADIDEVILATTSQLNSLSAKVYIQSKSYEQLLKLVKSKEQLLASIPAIQPISNKKLDRMASGYGYRVHPIYKTVKMHTGMDFSANTGTEIYATGEGVVEDADASMRGYGNCVVINHGYGYKTLYGHMSRIKVRPGQKVKRGEVIGLVGSTGTSTSPHLHYEVRRGNNPINPINFFYTDITPQEYEAMIELAERSNQSFD